MILMLSHFLYINAPFRCVLLQEWYHIYNCTEQQASMDSKSTAYIHLVGLEHQCEMGTK